MGLARWRLGFEELSAPRNSSLDPDLGISIEWMKGKSGNAGG
jgi:hypothetical protein